MRRKIIEQLRTIFIKRVWFKRTTTDGVAYRLCCTDMDTVPVPRTDTGTGYENFVKTGDTGMTIYIYIYI